MLNKYEFAFEVASLIDIQLWEILLDCRAKLVSFLKISKRRCIQMDFEDRGVLGITIKMRIFESRGR